VEGYARPHERQQNTTGTAEKEEREKYSTNVDERR
jgi:hypothetical protein